MSISGALRTTYPTWHQPWACLGCEKHGEVIVRVENMNSEWLRGMARGIDAEHRKASPMCRYDISSKPKGRPVPMVLGRPYRRNAAGDRIWAQGPNEDEAMVACRVKKEVWPPWLEQAN